MRPKFAGMFHVTARSIAEEHVFRDSGDYSTAISILAEVVAQGLLSCHLFCFMPTHYHLLASFDDAQLARAVHRLHRRYATRFNRRYGRHEHVFDSPYTANWIDTDGYLFSVVRYIALNPPEHETWPFSSYPGLIGTRPPFTFVDPKPIVDVFGSVARLRRFVDNGWTV